MSMKLGQLVRLPDGRVGTAVFNGLTGVGIKWGRHKPDPADFEGSAGDCFGKTRPKDWPWYPDAMLRDPRVSKTLGMPCVCDESRVELLEEEE